MMCLSLLTLFASSKNSSSLYRGHKPCCLAGHANRFVPVLCTLSLWGKLTLFGISSLSTSVSAGHVLKLSVPSLGSQECRVTWPAAGINAIMAFACVAAQFTAATLESATGKLLNS